MFQQNNTGMVDTIYFPLRYFYVYKIDVYVHFCICERGKKRASSCCLILESV